MSGGKCPGGTCPGGFCPVTNKVCNAITHTQRQTIRGLHL